jgi:ABC-type Fe3+-siderophore transport system permease subunit
MRMRILALTIVVMLFGTLSAIALLDVGYLGLITPHFKAWGAGQVFADLVIMCVLGCLWMVSDSRQRGTSAWPFVVLTLVAGSFGPLCYLMWRELRPGVRAQTSPATARG